MNYVTRGKGFKVSSGFLETPRFSETLVYIASYVYYRNLGIVLHS